MQALMWLVTLLIIAGMFASLIYESNRRARRTSKEFERELAEQRSSMMRAGMLELDRFVGEPSQKRAAVEFLRDEEQGQTKAGAKGDDSERTATREAATPAQRTGDRAEGE